MGLEVKGIREITQKLHNLEHVINKREVNSALKAAAIPVKNEMVKESPKDTGQGSEEITIAKKTRTYKSKAKYQDVGLPYGEWKYGETPNHGGRGVWYQHWGYEMKNGKFHVGSGWMDKAWDKSRDEAARILKSEMGIVLERTLKKNE